MQKRLEVLGAVLAVVGFVCLGNGCGDGTAGCASDKDCKGDRICASGECVDPDGTSGEGEDAGNAGDGGSAGIGGVARGGNGGTDFARGGNRGTDFVISGGIGGASSTGGTGGTAAIDGSMTGGAGGTDGSVNNAAPNYTNNGDGTTTDDSTGLMWVRCSGGQEYSECSGVVAGLHYEWENALDYCETLEVAGYDDWRLPNVYELVSIVDYSRNPPIDSFTFLGTRFERFWSSSPDVNYNPDPGEAPQAWYVDFTYGNVSSDYTTAVYEARCVRGEPLVLALFEPSVIDGERVVLDIGTGLMWQGCPGGRSGSDCSEGNKIDLSVEELTLGVCDSLLLAGYDDWRLPSVHELISIVDYSKVSDSTPYPLPYKALIDDVAFPYTHIDCYWSSSTFVDKYEEVNPWSINFSYGNVEYDEGSCSTRCVRDGQ